MTIRAKSSQTVKVLSVEFEVDMNGLMFARVAGLAPDALTALGDASFLVRQMVEGVNVWQFDRASSENQASE